MKFFDIFTKPTHETKAISVTMPVEGPTEAKEEVCGETVEAKPSAARQPLTVSYATGWPIDVIYGYLNKNNEDRGYEDAMVNCNLTFRDMNKSIIKNKILMVFREVNLKYDVYRQDLQSKKGVCTAAGLMADVANIEKTILLVDAHKEEIKKLEDDFRAEGSETSVPLQSYECGFLRGLSVVATGGIIDRNTETRTVSDMSARQANA